MRQTHIYSGVILAILALFCVVWWIPNATTPSSSEAGLDPSLVPTLAAAVCLVMAILLVVQAVMTPPEYTGLDDEFGAEATGGDRTVLANCMLWCAVAAVVWLVMEYVGFEPAMTIMLVATFLYVGSRSPWAIGLIAVLVPIVIAQLVWFSFSTILPAFWR